jgi:hypothetical protein
VGFTTAAPRKPNDTFYDAWLLLLPPAPSSTCIAVQRVRASKVTQKGQNMANDLQEFSSLRISPERRSVNGKLGFLAELAGAWEGEGFNLIARPDNQGGSPRFLKPIQTFETLSFIPISSSIPNRAEVA